MPGNDSISYRTAPRLGHRTGRYRLGFDYKYEKLVIITNRSPSRIVKVQWVHYRAVLVLPKADTIPALRSEK
jgi:hypothetical protein